MGNSQAKSQVNASHSSATSLYLTLFSVFRRELRIAFRQQSDMINPILFFLMVVTMMPLGISPQASVLSELAP